jgi:hypothetical protein
MNIDTLERSKSDEVRKEMGATVARRDQNEEPLVPVDVDNRPATVVVSVRLESDLARELTAFARGRGLRLSDVLRDAARSFTDRQGTARTLNYLVEGATEVSVGGRPWQSNRVSFGPDDANAKTIPWGPATVSR